MILVAILISYLACVIEHEMAHIGGWPGNHPGAVFKVGCGRALMPPHKFPVKHKPIIRYMDHASVSRMCLGARACSLPHHRPPIIFISNDIQ